MDKPDAPPPFHLQPLVTFAQQEDIINLTEGSPAPSLRTSASVPQNALRAFISGSASARGLATFTGAAPPVQEKVEIRCAEAFECNLYIGCSDGTLLWYTLNETDRNADPYTLQERHQLPSRKPVSRIALIPRLSKALVLSDGTLYFYLLPSLEPIPIALINHIRGVLTFALDDADVFEHPEDADATGLCVLTRRGVGLWSLRERLLPIKEVPLPYRGLIAKRYAEHMFIASDALYHFVDLSSSQSTEFAPIPVNQTQVGASAIPPRPSIITVAQHEFLITLDGGAGALGLFLKNGDPVRGTLEWELLPRALAVDWPYVAALLPNGKVVVHSIETLRVVQIVDVPTSLGARTMSSSMDGLYAPSGANNRNLELVPIRLIPPVPETPEEPGSDPQAPQGGSGLTPPPSPPPKSAKTAPPAFTRTHLLLVGSSGVAGLLPQTLSAQCEALLAEHKTDQALALVAAADRREGGTPDAGVEREMQYIRQKVALGWMAETKFQRAGEELYQGRLDPRLLIRLWPDLRGGLVGEEDQIDVFSGVKEQLEELVSIEQIVMDNLVKNYAPHLKPDVEHAPAGSELKDGLMGEAKQMLRTYLEGVRRERTVWSRVLGSDMAKVERLVDTVMIKILVEDPDARELYRLMDSSKAYDVAEVEKWFLETNHYGALVRLYNKLGQEVKLLDALVNIVDGVWEEDDVPNPVAKVAELVQASRDRDVVQKYGLWLLRTDPVLGLKLFTTRDPKRAVKIDEQLVLDEMMSFDESVGEQFLEWLIFQRRNTEKRLHDMLARKYLGKVEKMLRSPDVVRSWDGLVEQYLKEAPRISFLTFFGRSNLPTQELKGRLKLTLFLQASTLYDVVGLSAELNKHAVLKVEGAILAAKSGDHRTVIETLVNGLSDFTSAQSYCTSGGEIIGPEVARAATAPFDDLKPLATYLADGGSVGKGKKAGVPEDAKRDLLGILVQVQMTGGERMAKQTARLLNAQAVYFDMFETLSDIPETWQLKPIAPFLTRSFRHAIHERHEAMILKGISSSQNLEISERLWEMQRAEGAVIEEPADGDEPGGAMDYIEKGGVPWIEKPDGSDDVLDIHLDHGDRGLL
ncbi:hypothetical protein CALCODRAFT_493514 [Calocera cornea HHB12733]|uniref:CNH domain-containing protein n=1 Tax=Calocera cornea HHB12733 TaxID=1353952 RepID=A0A165HPP2_9BASI|nr:hypothetical protein CALCODRAFT_493514 [Calocera cornea HHB12733]